MSETEILRFLGKRWESVLPLIACVLAFFLRYHFLVTYRYPMMIHEQDAVGYMEVAKNMAHFQSLNMAGRPPGYPVVIALFALLPIGLEYAARLASIFMDALIVFPLFVLARVYLSRFPAFAVCLLWAFFSFSLIFSPSPLSQSSFLFYLLAGIVLLHRGVEKKENGWFFVSGALLALSFLTRPEGIIGVGCGFLLCLVPLFRKGGFNGKGAVPPIVFLLGFLLLAGPYLIALHNHLGYWALTIKTEAALKTQDGMLILNSKGELARTRAGESIWKEFYGTLPVFFGAVWNNIKAYFIVYYKTFPFWMHIVSLVGMISILWGKKAQAFLYILILLAVTTPNYIVNVSKTHSYLYPVFPVMFICFFACFEMVARGLGRKIEESQPAVKPVTYEVGLAIVLFFTVSYISLESYQEADANYQSPGLVGEAMMTERIFKEAGEFIKNNSLPSDVIMTRWGLVGYFADRRVLTLPKGEAKEVVDYGRGNGARFLLIDTPSVLSRRQELMELLEPLGGKTVNPAYGIEVFSQNYYPDLGGYVIYRYARQRN